MAKKWTLNFSGLEVGNSYSQAEIARIGNVLQPEGSRDPVWSKGLASFANAVALFVTLQAVNIAKHPYCCRFDGHRFWWCSQKQRTQRSPEIRHIASESTAVLLFVRSQASLDGLSRPFIYMGRLAKPVIQGRQPVEIWFDCIDINALPTGVP